MKLDFSFSFTGSSIRKRIDPRKICDKCSAKFKWQTKEGYLLCDRCFQLHLKQTQTSNRR